MKRVLSGWLLLAACAQEPAPVARAPKAAPTADCGPELPGFDRVANAPMILIGEVHGMVGPPAFAGNLVCREALRAGQATLALEIHRTEQPRLDAYLASDGGDAAKAALLEGSHWTRPFQDGRSSVAELALIEKARHLIQGGLPLRVAAVDGDGGQAEREKAMAEEVIALARAKHGPVVMLVGNYHAHTAPGAPWDPALRFMGVIVKEAIPETLALDVRYGDGDAWICTTSEASECGRKRSKGSGKGPVGAIELFGSPDEAGLSGTYFIGAAAASEPARGLSPAQAAAALTARFRETNKPQIVDGVPAGSSLALDARGEWCRRILPVARERLALPGDTLGPVEDCAVTLVPEKARQVVADVRVRFDLGFFYAKPYAAASYDREAKTLFLPLASLAQSWAEVGATRHEWLHARHHARARSGEAANAALMTVIEGNDYRPDGFYADEVPVNLCDAVDAFQKKKFDAAGSLEMVESYVGILRKELDAMKAIPKSTPKTRAGVTGLELASTDANVRWLGGRDAKRSLAALESVWKDATAAIGFLRATPPDISAATRLPLLAGDACDPSTAR